MDEFKTNTVWITTLKKEFSDIYKRYPEYVTQQQAAEICQVNDQTIRKWEKSGDLLFTPMVNGLLHYHQIKLDDLLIKTAHSAHHQKSGSSPVSTRGFVLCLSEIPI